MASCERSAGVKERRHADEGSPGNLGSLVLSSCEDAAGGVEEVVQAAGASARAVGANGARHEVRWNEGNEVKPKEGTPQGGVITP
jgi:hypothetical protein